MAERPTGTVTFLFSDIEGSTGLLHELGAERYGDALDDHRRLLREAFARHDGYEVDTQGDAFFVAFNRAQDAVRAAGDSQRSLAGHDWPQGGDLRVRVGIHTCEVAATREEIGRHTSELQSHHDLVCRLLLEKKKNNS